MKANFGLFCCSLVSLLRYSHGGVRARKGEKNCLKFLVVNCVSSGGSRGDPGVRANPPLDPC